MLSIHQTLGAGLAVRVVGSIPTLPKRFLSLLRCEVNEIKVKICQSETVPCQCFLAVPLALIIMTATDLVLIVY